MIAITTISSLAVLPWRRPIVSYTEYTAQSWRHDLVEGLRMACLIHQGGTSRSPVCIQLYELLCVLCHPKGGGGKVAETARVTQ